MPAANPVNKHINALGDLMFRNPDQTVDLLRKRARFAPKGPRTGKVLLPKEVADKVREQIIIKKLSRNMDYAETLFEKAAKSIKMHLSSFEARFNKMSGLSKERRLDYEHRVGQTRSVVLALDNMIAQIAAARHEGTYAAHLAEEALSMVRMLAAWANEYDANVHKDAEREKTTRKLRQEVRHRETREEEDTQAKGLNELFNRTKELLKESGLVKVPIIVQKSAKLHNILMTKQSRDKALASLKMAGVDAEFYPGGRALILKGQRALIAPKKKLNMNKRRFRINDNFDVLIWHPKRKPTIHWVIDKEEEVAMRRVFGPPSKWDVFG